MSRDAFDRLAREMAEDEDYRVHVRMERELNRAYSTQYPVGHLLNPATPYRNAASTDIRATFAKIKQQQEQRQ